MYAPFDSDLDERNPHVDIPERFVYDAPMDADGLAEMAGPERDEVLDQYAYETEGMLAELAAEAANERWFEDRGWLDYPGW
jgi:hypothetical protein